MRPAAEASRFLRIGTACLWAIAAHAVLAQTSDDSVTPRRPFAGLLSRPELSASAKREQVRNASIVSGVSGPSKVGEALASQIHFPKSLNDLGAELKFGTHKIVSADGENVIGLMREATSANDPNARSAALSQLKQLAAGGSPEAQTFIGFAVELGLFGASPDSRKALAYYQAAAAKHYQPAIYNLALDAAYGRGRSRSREEAIALVAEASAVGPEASFRVCGFDAFLNYRSGAASHALASSKGCGSPLAAMAMVATDQSNQPLGGERLTSLRNSIGTGVDDGYRLLEQVASRNADSDPQLMFCKYALVSQLRNGYEVGELRQRAAACIDRTISTWRGTSNLKAQRDQLVGGITSFVVTEIKQLAAMRQANRFHYAWPAPYLPFRQQDVDLFAKVVGDQP